jgi:hypothetical protein
VIELHRGYSSALRGEGGTYVRTWVSPVFRCTLCNTHRLTYAEIEVHPCTPIVPRGRVPKRLLTKHQG